MPSYIKKSSKISTSSTKTLSLFTIFTDKTALKILRETKPLRGLNRYIILQIMITRKNPNIHEIGKIIQRSKNSKMYIYVASPRKSELEKEILHVGNC